MKNKDTMVEMIAEVKAMQSVLEHIQYMIRETQSDIESYSSELNENPDKEWAKKGLVEAYAKKDAYYAIAGKIAKGK